MTTTPTPASQPSPSTDWPHLPGRPEESRDLALQPSPARSDKDAGRAKFEHWMVHEAKFTVGSKDPYPAGIERDWWRVWQAAIAAQESAPSSDSISESIQFQAALVDLLVCTKNGRSIGVQTEKIDALVAAIDAALARRATAGNVAAPVYFYRREAGENWREATAEHIAHLEPFGGYEFRTLYESPVATAAPTDEQIVAALHACGIDTRASKYGFDALQIDGTSVPNLRNVFAKLYATPAATAAPGDLPLDVEFKQLADSILQATTNVARLEALRSMAVLFDRCIASNAGAAPGKPTCPECGKHEVELSRTCHNSSCFYYATAMTIYRGWKSAPIFAGRRKGEHLMLWTVVRFPNDSWSYGGKPDDPDYAACEVWLIEASDGKAAVKKARDKRCRDAKKNDLLTAGAKEKA